jgi:ABC-type glycerol-3-phosphate transport system substrate-binding protein
VAFNGAWCINVYPEMNGELDFGVFPTPTVSDAYPMRLWGSAGASLLVNAISPNADKAVDFLQWLTEAEQQSIYAKETNSIPSNIACLDDIPPVQAQFAKGFENVTHPSSWPIMESPGIIEAFDKGIQLILIGAKTPQGLAEELEKLKARARERSK